MAEQQQEGGGGENPAWVKVQQKTFTKVKKKKCYFDFIFLK